MLDRPATSHPECSTWSAGSTATSEALDAVERLASAERARVTLVFNGDFHWFDAESAWFAELDRRVARLRRSAATSRPRSHGRTSRRRLRVRLPETVDDGVVQRSNLILGELRTIATTGVQERLATLPMHRVAQVGELRIGIVHGDAAALAGWRFDPAALDDPANRAPGLPRSGRVAPRRVRLDPHLRGGAAGSRCPAGC